MAFAGLSDLDDRLRGSVPFRALVDALRSGGRIVRLPLPAAAWVLDLLRREHGRRLLVVVPHEADALAWLEGAALAGAADVTVSFPAPSLTPYQDADVSLPVRAQEAIALDRVLAGEAETVVCTARALFRLLPEPAAFRRAAVTLRPGEDRPLEELVEHLVRIGYRRCDLVSEVGELAVRGGVVDLFPPGEELPLRVELFGDTIESLRRFDPLSQRSSETVDSLRVLPLGLFPAGQVEALRLADLLEAAADENAGLEAAESVAALRDGGRFPGWESYLPLLSGERRLLPELLGTGSDAPIVVAVDGPSLRREVEHHAAQLQADCALRRAHRRLALNPELLEQSEAAVASVVDGATLELGDLLTEDASAIDFAAHTTDLFHGQMPRFPREVEVARRRGERLLVVAAPGHRKRLQDLLEGREVPIGRDGAEIVEGELERGFRLPAAGVVLYGEPQLLPRGVAERAPAKLRRNPFLAGLRDLKLGDFVVHRDHGIGQFVALRKVGPAPQAVDLPPILRRDNAEAASDVEAMEIAYASGKRLLVPLARMDLVQKYSGIEGVAPRLDQLGGTSWNKTKARVKAGMREMAEELLKLYAERQLARAPTMPPDTDLLRQFEAAFPYDETPDQLEAIAAIKKDLEGERPMDRLLCGDVGYGKTEVAMRAAFKVVDGGHQVAVLAPTTILADQHLEVFRRRYDGFPVTIDMVSRFRTPAEVKEIKKRLADGKIDILIGTHRLLGKDLEIPKLGLLVVDEEQRFGVAQKERLKQMRKNVHVLAMSATPVPRTLQLSLAGVRDMSVIETPPRDRMAVETAIVPFAPELVREAIEYERDRGGQVFYVYNRVENIERLQEYLRELVPGLRITVGHGQLDEHELERRMHAFVKGEFDLLLATTIIENGIDIPNVNTMIVHRADRFGLAQLYQLRGRVGRSNQLAYCYFLVPQDRVVSEIARKRLAALREFSDLGAGFRIAARDLEIRGAGNLLGAEQSGHIMAVGIETYLKMLEETVRELRGETVEEAPSTQIDLPVTVAIPADYVEDANLRMELYRRVASSDEAPQELLAELRDRFGPPPHEVLRLVELAAVKRLAESLRVQSISMQGRKVHIRMRRDARVDIDKLIAMVAGRPGATFSPAGVLTLENFDSTEVLPAIRETLGELAA